MKNAMIGGLTVLFVTGYILAHSASAQPLTPLANHQSGAVNLVGWGDNGQGGGYGGTPSGNSGGGYGGGQQQNNSGGGYGGSNNNSGSQGGTYNNNSGSQGGTYQGQGSQGGYGGNNNGGGNNGNNGGGNNGSSGTSGNNGSSGTSGNTSGGNKAKQAVCLGRCHKDCQLDAIANHKPGDPFIIPKVCLDGCKQRCL